MWYRDIVDAKPNAIRLVADYFDCSDEAAIAIVAECDRLHKLGNAGEPYGAVRVRGEYHDRRTLEEWCNLPSSVDRFGGVDTSDLAALLYDAWTDGIQRIDRVVVHLDSQGEQQCPECGSCDYKDCVDATDANHAVTCSKCSTVYPLTILATVSHPFAELWADNDGYIDGSTWESVGNGEIYTLLTDRPSLVDDLKAEGYRLDLGSY